jgi:protein TonB
VLIAHLYAFTTKIENRSAIKKSHKRYIKISLNKAYIKKPKPAPPTPPKKIEKKFLVEPIILPLKKIETTPPLRKSKKVKKQKRKKERTKKRVSHTKPAAKTLRKTAPPQQIISKPLPKPTINDNREFNRYLSYIRREIKRNLYYPKIAKKLKIEGVVKIFFRVMRNGSVADVEVLNSSNGKLTKAALKTINSLSLKPIPSTIGKSNIEINIPVEFRLNKR